MKLIWSLNHKRAVTQEQVMEIRIVESIRIGHNGVALFGLIVVPFKGDPLIVVEKPTHFEAQVFAQELMD